MASKGYLGPPFSFLLCSPVKGVGVFQIPLFAVTVSLSFLSSCLFSFLHPLLIFNRRLFVRFCFSLIQKVLD